MIGPRTTHSRALWLARQYYFQMLADALDTFVPNPEACPRDNAADSLIHAMRLVGAAIAADEPKDPPPCPDESPVPPNSTPPESTPGESSTSAASTPSAADSTLTSALAPMN